MCKRGEAKSGPPSALVRYSSLRDIWILPFRALESDVYGNEAVKQGTLPPRSCPDPEVNPAPSMSTEPRTDAIA